MEGSHRNSFKKLLDRLQEESWQLELLVSGFVIFGLFYAIEPVQLEIQYAMAQDEGIKTKLFQIVWLSIYILIFTLIIHLLLRCLWIAALGLRYVSGDIELNNLKYSGKFKPFLDRKIFSFDSYIEQLEKYSSLIFTLSFLLIFYNFSFFTIIIIRDFISEIGDYGDSPFFKILSLGLILLLLFGALLTLIDFLTLGYLKRNKWTSKIYYPFYRVFSIITLSFIYRPLVYNLLDHKLGRTLGLAITPLYIVVLILSNSYFEKSNYFKLSSTHGNSSITTAPGYYYDLVGTKSISPNAFTIQSKVIESSFLNIRVL